jgi:hypothetical protein
MGEWNNILPGCAAGGNVPVDKQRIRYFIHNLPFQ